MSIIAPPCKNCGGHFNKDHTHIFHGEDICDKDPNKGYVPLEVTFAGKPLEWHDTSEPSASVGKIRLDYKPVVSFGKPWYANYSGDGRNSICRPEAQDALDRLEALLREDLKNLKGVFGE